MEGEGRSTDSRSFLNFTQTDMSAGLCFTNPCLPEPCVSAGPSGVQPTRDERRTRHGNSAETEPGFSST